MGSVLTSVFIFLAILSLVVVIHELGHLLAAKFFGVLVEEFGLELVRKIPGVQVVIGEGPDYVELAFLHFDKTGERLFGEKHDYSFTRTKTPVGSGSVAVGNFSVKLGLEVFLCRDPEDLRVGIWIAPLVVPA